MHMYLANKVLSRNFIHWTMMSIRQYNKAAYFLIWHCCHRKIRSQSVEAAKFLPHLRNWLSSDVASNAGRKEFLTHGCENIKTRQDVSIYVNYSKIWRINNVYAGNSAVEMMTKYFVFFSVPRQLCWNPAFWFSLSNRHCPNFIKRLISVPPKESVSNTYKSNINNFPGCPSWKKKKFAFHRSDNMVSFRQKAWRLDEICELYISTCCCCCCCWWWWQYIRQLFIYLFILNLKFIAMYNLFIAERGKIQSNL